MNVVKDEEGYILPAMPEKEKRRNIRAEEIFNVIMNNILHPNIQKIVSKFIGNDPRTLSFTSIWLLKRRGYTNQIVDKIPN